MVCEWVWICEDLCLSVTLFGHRMVTENPADETAFFSSGKIGDADGKVNAHDVRL